MREHIFLHNDGLVTRHRDSELKYFHHVSFGKWLRNYDLIVTLV